MIKTKILFSISFLALSFLLLVFTALRMSGNSNLSSDYSLSLVTNDQKEVYVNTFCGEDGKANFVYPGILPNHPLYWAKMIRDRVKSYVVRNPEKRLALFLLYADKRLVSGIILLAEDETSLGVSTITKAEKYLQKAAIYTRDNLPEKENVIIYENLVAKYFDHRQEIEKLLISDLAEDKKQILHKLSEDSNVLFEDRYFDYVQKVNEECEIKENSEASESADFSDH